MTALAAPLPRSPHRRNMPARVANREKQLNEIAVSDRAALAGLTQFPATPAPMRDKPLNGKVIEEKLSDAPACAIISLRLLASD